MPVKIDKISVKNLGPLPQFEEEFGIFNIVYSPNEKGKTFLTEFIIRSLFKNYDRWNTIRKGGQGKVWVSGLADQSITFSPSSGKKLEDFWQEQNRGLPASIPNILMAKGSESSISPDGVNKGLIKEVLSGINVLDNIDSQIPKTVQAATLHGDVIDINKQGEGKTRDKITMELQHITSLAKKIETDYTLGISEDYRLKLNRIEKHLNLLNEAKKYKAWETAQKLRKFDEEKSNYPEEEINQLQQDIRTCKDTESDYVSKKKQYDKALNQSKHYDWLESARDNYREWTINRSVPVKPVYYILTGIFAFSVLVFMGLDLKIPAIATFLATIGGIGLILARFYRFTKNYGKHKELQEIKEAFQNTFNKELTELSVLEEELNKQKKAADEASFMYQEIKNNIEPKLQSLEEKIYQRFNSLMGEKPPKAEWEQKLNELRQRRKKYTDLYDEEREHLLRLQVNESDYRKEDPGIPYSKEEVEQYKKDQLELEEKLEQNEEKLRTLKRRICDVTSDDLHTTWDKLLENFRKVEKEKQEELKSINARIAAGIMVHELIQDFREQEDQKILEGLASDVVTTPLYDLTKRYNKLSLEGNNLVVSDNTGDYYLNELSTGAGEQIMLALRIGFSRKIVKKDALFLILDDTFQHSDWNKREMLVNKLAEIAGTGWQIIYFTMDDHIYNLFKTAGKKFKKDFKSIEL